MTILKGVRLLIAMAGMPVSTFCQVAALKVAPVPNDPLEMVSGPVQVVSTPEERDAILGLLSRARVNYSLRGSSKGYDLKVSFTVNSGGETEYDGAWEMEEIYGPRMGFAGQQRLPPGLLQRRFRPIDFTTRKGQRPRCRYVCTKRGARCSVR
jgi:hypothetical protein